MTGGRFTACAMALVGFAALSAAGVEFTRTERGAAKLGDRKRTLDRTWIFAERQIYCPMQNVLHTWCDRPLFADTSLRRPKDGLSGENRAFLRDVEIMQDCGLDGFGSIAYHATNKQHLKLLEAHPPAKTYRQMPVICPVASMGNYAAEKDIILAHAKSPYAARLDGRLVCWSYGGGTEGGQRYARRFAEDPEVPPLLYVGDMPFYDMYCAYGYDNEGKYDPKSNTIVPEKVEAFRRTVADAAAVLGGFQVWCTNNRWDWNGEYSHFQDPTPIYRDYLRPVCEEVMGRPENRGKLVGAYLRQGYFNNAEGTISGEHGTQTLRNYLDEILLLNPDVLMCFEWNEENENTHFQPTLAHGRTWTRILNCYRAILDRTEPTPMKGDDTTVPNLVLSARQAIKLGEPYHLELLYLPDGSAAKELKARVTLKDEKGATVAAFPQETIPAGALKEISYFIASEDLAGVQSVRPELETELDGAKRTWTGFDSTRLRPTMCRDYLYTHQSLRELLVPASQRFDVRATDEPDVYAVDAALGCGEELSSLEIVDDLEEMAAADTGTFFTDPDSVVLRGHLTTLLPALIGKGAGRVLKGVATTPGAPHAVLRSAEYAWECFSVNGPTDGGTAIADNFGSHGRFFVKVPKAELAGSRLRLDFKGLGFPIEAQMDEVYGQGVRSWELGKTVRFTLERLDNLGDIPAPLGTPHAALARNVRSANRFPAFQLRAITRSGKVWRSALVHPKAFAGAPRKLRVYSDTRHKEVAVDVPADAVPSFDYVFDPKYGARLHCPWGGHSDIELGGGEWRGGPMRDAEIHKRMPAGFAGQSAGEWIRDGDNYILKPGSAAAEAKPDAAASSRVDPEWVRDGGRWALRFGGGSYMCVPQEVIPRGAVYSVTMDLKPTTDADQVILRSSSENNGDLGVQLIVKDGTVRLSYLGVHLYRLYEFDTKLPLRVGEWNRIEIGKDYKSLVCVVNGEKRSFPYDRRAERYSTHVFGGNLARGENLPAGIRPFDGLLRAFTVRH